MQEAGALKDGRKEFQLFIEALMGQGVTCIPMRKIAIEPQVRKRSDEVDRAPDVLRDGPPVGLKEQRIGEPLACFDNCIRQFRDLRIAFEVRFLR